MNRMHRGDEGLWGTGLRLDGSSQSWEEARLLAASWSEGSRTGGGWDGIDRPSGQTAEA